MADHSARLMTKRSNNHLRAILHPALLSFLTVVHGPDSISSGRTGALSTSAGWRSARTPEHGTKPEEPEPAALGRTAKACGRACALGLNDLVAKGDHHGLSAV